jgi:hypothetical protein
MSHSLLEWIESSAIYYPTDLYLCIEATEESIRDPGTYCRYGTDHELVYVDSVSEPVILILITPKWRAETAFASPLSSKGWYGPPG